MAGAADRGNGNLVGQRQPDIQPVIRYVVRQRYDHRGILSEIDAAGRIGAMVVDQRSANTDDATVVIDSDFHIPVLIAFLRRANKMFTAILGPFYRLAQNVGRQHDRDVLRIEHHLWPEPAADIGGHDPDPVFVPAEHIDENIFRGMRRLGRRPQGYAVFIRIVGCHRAPAFKRMTAAAMLPDLFPEDIGGAGKCPIDIAILHIEFSEQIVRRIFVDGGRSIRQRRDAIGYGWQNIVIHIDQRGSVLGDIPAIGNHDGDGFADMDNFVVCQRRTVEVLPIGRAGQSDDHPFVGKMRFEIGQRKHAMHAGHRQSGILVDGFDDGVAVRAS